jgi:hypothetical protein
VKFEVRLVISFTRKTMPNKKRRFSWGMVHPFSKSGAQKSGQPFGFLNLRMPHGACVGISPNTD